MEKILNEWRKYLNEINTIEYSNTMSNLIAWLDGGGKVPDSITNADEKQKQAMEWAKVLSANSKKYGAYLRRDRRLIPTIQGLIKASKTVTGKEAEEVLAVRRDGHPISNMFADISRSVYQETGIKILDPTARKNPPAWAKEPYYAGVWATLQTVADFLASDPFSAAIMFVPFGKLGSVGVKALEQAGVKGAAKMAAMPVGEALVKYAPEKVAKILQTLETTEVKAVVADFHKNLAAMHITPQKYVVNYGGFPFADAYIEAARQTAKRAIGAGLTRHAEIVTKSIQAGRGIIYTDPSGLKRLIVVVNTKQGPIPFYRSTGTGGGGKVQGSWQIFGGFSTLPYKARWNPKLKIKEMSGDYPWFIKNGESVNLTAGADQYLTNISLAIGEAESAGMLRGVLRFSQISQVAKSNLKTINNKIRALNGQLGHNKYLLYNLETLQTAYVNKFLEASGTMKQTVYKTYFAKYGNQMIGLDSILSEKVTEGSVIGKILPSLDKVFGR